MKVNVARGRSVKQMSNISHMSKGRRPPASKVNFNPTKDPRPKGRKFNPPRGMTHRNVSYAAGAVGDAFDNASKMALKKGKYNAANAFSWAGLITSMIGAGTAIAALFKKN